MHAVDTCPYGIDLLLWVTHFAKLVTTFIISSYADTLELSRAAIYGQTMARVLFFVNVKAVLNTIMVYTGWKRPGAFKVTTKAGGAPTPAGGGAAPPAAPVAPPPPKEEEVERDTGGPTVPVRINEPSSVLCHARGCNQHHTISVELFIDVDAPPRSFSMHQKA